MQIQSTRTLVARTVKQVDLAEVLSIAAGRQTFHCETGRVALGIDASGFLRPRVRYVTIP